VTLKRINDTNQVGSVLSRMLDEYNISYKFHETEIISTWSDLVGKTIADKTARIFFKKKKLFVEITSAPLKNELTLSRSRVKEIIEKKFGKGIIEEVIFL